MKYVAVFLFLFGALSLAKVPRNLEPLLTESTLAVHEKKWSEALSAIDEMLKKSPELIEALELKALVYSSQGKLDEAKKVYSQLMSANTVPEEKNRKGLYAFEIGKIAYQQKNLDEAKKFLLQAVKEGSNIFDSHFLLGKIFWDQRKWSESRAHFLKCAQSDAYRSTAEFFVAESLKIENRSDEAVEHYQEARVAAQSRLDKREVSSMSAQKLQDEVIQLADKELSVAGGTAWTEEVGIASGYDSNVLFSPNTSDSTNVDAEGSFKQAINWKLQYSPVSTNRLQYQTQYQGSLNYNFNQETQGGQFFVHDVANFVFLGGSERQYGLKIGGTGAFQFRENTFKPFILSGSFGPFYKLALSDSWSIRAESFFQPTKVYQDTLISSGAKRSGWEQVTRISVTPRNPRGFWAPSFYVSGTLMRPSGQEFRGTRFNADFMNAMTLSPKTFMAQTAGISFASYPERSLSSRSDHGVAAGLAGGHQVSSAWLLMAQVDWMRNFSNDSNFEFQRWTGTLSGNYRF